MKKNIKSIDAILKDNKITIVDIGASGGVDSRWRDFTSMCTGILFEPDPREYDVLKKSSDNNLIVLNTALSDSPGDIKFHLCKKQQVSSVYQPNFEILDKYPDSSRFKVEKIIKIKADTLDNQLKKNKINEIDFIKIDTQGYELSILQGADFYMDKAIGLQIEVEFEQMYENQPLFADVDAFVRSKGFKLFDIKRYFWKRSIKHSPPSEKGQLIFGDALYLKDPESILNEDGISPEKIIRATSIYLAYGYNDLSQILLERSSEMDLIDENTEKKLRSILLSSKTRNSTFMRYLSAFLYKCSVLTRDNVPYSGTDMTIGN